MNTLYIAFDKALAVVYQRQQQWIVDFHLPESQPQCLAVDPRHPQFVYCGTFDKGVWQSSDGGGHWTHASEGIVSEKVMALAVSSQEQISGSGIVYAGTEPTALYRSEDRGESWRELATLRELPSASTWSFPPRPWTSHIRWIAPDPLQAGRLFAAVEAGALLRSLDGGQTWEDRKPGGPFDTHTLLLHRQAPDRLYSAAGDGFMQAGSGFVQSDDGGETWSRPDDGLMHHYLWSAAVNPADPETLVVSAALGPQQAHQPQAADATVYQRSGDLPWHEVQAGLPPTRGSLAMVLATTEAEPGVFYAANNRGVFSSTDAGLHWKALPIPWPEPDHLPPGRANALLVVSD